MGLPVLSEQSPKPRGVHGSLLFDGATCAAATRRSSALDAVAVLCCSGLHGADQLHQQSAVTTTCHTTRTYRNIVHSL